MRVMKQRRTGGVAAHASAGALVGAIALLPAGSASADPPDHTAGLVDCKQPTKRQASSAAATTSVVAGMRYDAGGFMRLIAGAGYRDAWVAEIDVPVLDVTTFASGLVPLMRVGGMATKSLALRGCDGRSYTFRSIEKDFSEAVPEALRGTLIEETIQDQAAATLPAGAVVAGRLTRAAGVLGVTPSLVALPDHPGLGTFRKDFAGRLGTVEEYPMPGKDGAPGTFGAVKIISGADMLDLIGSDPTQHVDARAFLKARLVDLFLGDWDRHIGQWRFARIPGQRHWQPIAEDRDFAFSDYGGLAILFMRDKEPKFAGFGDSYPGMEGATWNGRDSDRRLLAGVARETYAKVADELRASLTDKAIADAVALLPKKFYDKYGPALIEALEQRRNKLPDAALEFYDYFSDQVDVRATNQAEHVTITTHSNGDVEIVMWPASVGAKPGPAVADATFFRRTFREDETDEVRVYLGGGDDRIVVGGEPSNDISVHLVGGGGGKVVTDLTSDAITAFGPGDARTSVRSGLSLESDEAISAGSRPTKKPPQMSATWRDFGGTTYFAPVFGLGNDIGLVFGAGLTHENYGFRRWPWAERHRARVSFSTGVLRPRTRYNLDVRTRHPWLAFGVDAITHGFELTRFYGQGNESSDVAPAGLDEDAQDDFFSVNHWRLGLEPTIAFLLQGFEIRTGPTFQLSITDADDGTLIAERAPYGDGVFAHLGWLFRTSFDSRRPARPDLPWDPASLAPISFGEHVPAPGFSRDPEAFTSGVRINTEARVFPPVAHVTKTYATVRGSLSGTVAFAKRHIEYGVLLGAQRNVGPFPYFEAAYIGSRAVRGLRRNRFAGERMAYGSTELRFRLPSVTVLLPFELGFFGLADLGRVFVPAESSDLWHYSVGGGLWIAPIELQNLVSIAIAKSDETVGVKGDIGFRF